MYSQVIPGWYAFNFFVVFGGDRGLRFCKDHENLLTDTAFGLRVGFSEMRFKNYLIIFLLYQEWQMCGDRQTVFHRNDRSETVTLHKRDNLLLIFAFVESGE